MGAWAYWWYWWSVWEHFYGHASPEELGPGSVSALRLPDKLRGLG